MIKRKKKEPKDEIDCIKILNEKTTDEHSVRIVLSSLRKFFSRADTKKIQFIENDGILIILNVLNIHRKSADIVRIVCSCLCSLMIEKSAKNKVIF